MNIRMIGFVLGRILLVEAGLLTLPLAVALLYREPAMPWLITMAALVVCGALLSFRKPERTALYAKDGFAAVALVWLLMSAFGALPFVLSGDILHYVDAFFETVSGFTTTGASILPAVEPLSRGSLFWRSFTHWVGGMGVLVFVMAILPMSDGHTMHILRAEMPGPTAGKLVSRMSDTAKILYYIYIGLTIGETICLRLAGMNWYDALTHSFTTISTGGFSVRNASIAAYDSMLIDWIIIIFMFLSGINFALLFYAVRRNFKAVFESEELRSYTIMAVAASALIVANLVLKAGWTLNAETITDATFQVVTLMTTTGYMTYDYVLWPTFSQTVLILVMFAGACAGSTAGGVKQIRVVLLFKNLHREIQRILPPRAVKTIRCDGDRVEEPILSGITLFFFAYIMLLLAGTLVVAWDDIGFTAAFTASLTCISNVGPAFDILGPTSNFSMLSGVSKIVLSLNMLLGRLEIMPLLLLVFPGLWKKR